MKERVQIELDHGQGTLEGVVQTNEAEHRGETARGVILSHPHPEYGGNMNNIVVRTLETAYLDNGYTTLRFNFRGTGHSRGRYDDFLELTRDVLAAFAFLQEQGISQVALAGYSFGSWVNAHTDFKESVMLHQLLVSPPVSFMDFTDVPGFSCPCHVICGDRDEFVHLKQLKTHLDQWQVDTFKEIPGCDHFYSGMQDTLYHAVTEELLQDRG